MAARRSPTNALLRRLRRKPGHSCVLGLLVLGLFLFWHRQQPRSTTLRGVTVVIDPGHGGADPGAVCEGVAEAALTYRTAATLARVLEDRSARSVFTVRSASLTERGAPKPPRDATPELAPGRVLQSGRVNPEDIYVRADLAAREWDRKKGPVVFLSLHFDSRPPGVRGSHTLHDHRSSPSRLAQNIAREFSAAGLRGSFPSTPTAQKLGVLWSGRNPVPERVLVECAVLSDPGDRANAQNPAWRERFCNLLADAIEKSVKN